MGNAQPQYSDITQRLFDEAAIAETALERGDHARGKAMFESVMEQVRAICAADAPDVICKKQHLHCLTERRTQESEKFCADFDTYFAEDNSHDDAHKILLLSDSIALPRAQVTFDEVYAVRLQKRLGRRSYRISPFSMRSMLSTGCEYHVQNTLKERGVIADTVIVQSGLVDLMPRIFDVTDAACLFHIGGRALRSRIIDISKAHGNVLRRGRHDSTYVDLKQFGESMDRALQALRENVCAKRIIVIGVVTPLREGQRAGGDLYENVLEYNACLKSLVEKHGGDYLDADEQVWSQPNAVECFMDDRYHLTGAGHKVLAAALEPMVKRIA